MILEETVKMSRLSSTFFSPIFSKSLRGTFTILFALTIPVAATPFNHKYGNNSMLLKGSSLLYCNLGLLLRKKFVISATTDAPSPKLILAYS